MSPYREAKFKFPERESVASKLKRHFRYVIWHMPKSHRITMFHLVVGVIGSIVMLYNLGWSGFLSAFGTILFFGGGAILGLCILLVVLLTLCWLSRADPFRPEDDPYRNEDV
jgi:hypothetical protein